MKQNKIKSGLIVGLLAMVVAFILSMLVIVIFDVDIDQIFFCLGIGVGTFFTHIIGN